MQYIYCSIGAKCNAMPIASKCLHLNRIVRMKTVSGDTMSGRELWRLWFNFRVCDLALLKLLLNIAWLFSGDRSVAQHACVLFTPQLFAFCSWTKFRKPWFLFGRPGPVFPAGFFCARQQLAARILQQQFCFVNRESANVSPTFPFANPLANSTRQTCSRFSTTVACAQAEKFTGIF